MRTASFGQSIISFTACATLLSACGGGGGGGGNGGGGGGQSAAGGYTGTIADGSGHGFDMLVLADGSFWMLYGPANNGVVNVDGFIEGAATQDTAAQTFSSSDSLDFGLSPSTAAPVTGSYTAASITGSIDYAASKAKFTGTPIPATFYAYSATPKLTDLDGTWDMGSLVGSGSKMTVTTDARGTTLRGVNDAGCNFTGTFTADISGKNVFDVDIKFQGAPCTRGTAEYKGITLLTHGDNATQLMLAGVDVATRKMGIAATGLSQQSGGGGSGQGAAGGYGGHINDAAGNQFDMVVMDDGTYWVMYGKATNGVVNVTGFLEGTATEDTTAQTFSSSDALDFGFSPAGQATVSGTYTGGGSGGIGGTIFYSAGNQPTFSGTPIAAVKYDYSATPVLSDLAGTWSMATLAGQGSQIVIAGDGSFVGTTPAGCNFDGRFSPDASGKNVFDSDMTFGGGACPQGNGEFTGIAIMTHIGGGTQLVLAGIDSTDSIGVAATGVRAH